MSLDATAVDAFNGLLAAHDRLEDPITVYERVVPPAFAGLLVVLAFGARDERAVAARRAAVASGAALTLALAAAQLLSLLVARPRPFAVDAGIELFARHAADSGFPSDHATASFAIATALVPRFPRTGRVLLAAAAGLAIGRVGMGVHYPSDVLAGALIGAAAALLLNLPRPRRAIEAATDRIAAALGRLPGAHHLVPHPPSTGSHLTHVSS